jgi:hypothetical protein
MTLGIEFFVFLQSPCLDLGLRDYGTLRGPTAHPFLKNLIHHQKNTSLLFLRHEFRGCCFGIRIATISEPFRSPSVSRRSRMISSFSSSTVSGGFSGFKRRARQPRQIQSSWKSPRPSQTLLGMANTVTSPPQSTLRPIGDRNHSLEFERHRVA